MESEPNIYDLCPISQGGGAIRILRLHPAADRDAPLRGTLVDTNLADAKGTYDAISYVWGSEERSHVISISFDALRSPEITSAEGEASISTPITASLAAALRDFRLLDEDRPVWADALCINQADDAEKTYQVSQMRHVFQYSQCTLGHINQKFEDLEAILAYRDCIIAQDAISNGIYEQSSDDASDNHNRATAELPSPALIWDPNRGIVNSADIIVHTYEEVADGWAAFFSCRCFFRVWIFQELVLAPDLRLHIGGEHIPSTVLDRLLRAVDSSERNATFFNVSLQRIYIRTGFLGFLVVYMMRRRDTPPPLLEIVERLAFTLAVEATDPRDRLYALLGISAEWDDPTLTPDYSLDTEEAFLRYCQVLIQRPSGYLLLEDARRHSNPNRPSWVPDFAGQSPVYSMMPYMSRELQTPYKLDDSGLILQTGAVCVGIITILNPVFGGCPPDYVGSLAEDPISGNAKFSIGREVLRQVEDLMTSQPAFLRPGEDIANATFEFIRFGSEREDRRDALRERYAISWIEVLLNMSGLFDIEKEREELESEEFETSPFMQLLIADGGWPLEAMRQMQPITDDQARDRYTMFNIFSLWMGTYMGWILFWVGRRLGKTEVGYVCSLDERAQEGDVVAVVDGVGMPLILREVSQGRYTIIGHAHVHALEVNPSAMRTIELV